jgi:hypothetical protein
MSLAQAAAEFDVHVEPHEKGGLEVHLGDRGWRDSAEATYRLKVRIAPQEIEQCESLARLIDVKARLVHDRLQAWLERRA